MKKRSVLDAAISVIALILGLIIIFPVIYCVLGAFKTPSEFLNPKLLPGSFTYLENFKDALNKGNLLRYAGNSFIVAFFGTLIRLIFSTLSAYVFAYYDFKGKNLIFFLFLGTMMIPGDVLLTTNYLTVSRARLLNTYFACMAVYFVSASQMFILRQKFKSLPRSLREAARIDGYGDFGYIKDVLLPVCKPLLTTLFIQSFISLWNAYLWPLIVTASSPNMRTVTVGITRLNSWEDENYQLVLAGVVLSLIPSLILFLIMRKNYKTNGEDSVTIG